MGIQEIVENSPGVLLFMAIQAAREAGGVIREVYGSDFAVEHKDDHSPLTLADTRSHGVISRRLNDVTGPGSPGSYPGLAEIPFLSEEGRDVPYEVRSAWEWFWLVDPLDGTKEFVKRNGEFTVNIALIHGDAPVLGVIYVPVTDVLYFAFEGLGAYRVAGRDAEDSLGLGGIGADYASHMVRGLMREDRRLPLKNKTPGAPGEVLTVVASRSHRSEKVDRFVEDLQGTHARVEYLSAGSALKFCLVAEGRADIYPRFGPTMEWDTGAGQCIVEESGGSVRDLEGRRFSYNKENLLNGEFIVRGASLGATDAAGDNSSGNSGSTD